MKGSRQYDLVIFGASAFTGQFVVEEVATVTKEAANKKLSWAIAGRSQRKLNDVLKKATKETGQDLSKIDIIIADIDNVGSLREMAKLAKVILTVVGPYTLYGENVVKACIAEGTSCVDLSGEANFLEKMQVKYHAEAEKAGCFIVGSCGMDSIPSDCGVTHLQKHFGGDVNSIELYFETRFKGTPPKLHSGTYFSAIELFSHEHELDGYRQLLMPKKAPTPKYKLENMGLLHYSNEVKGWCVPFPGVDVSIVNRSQYILNEVGTVSRPVQFEAYVKLPLILCILSIIGAYIFVFVCKFKLGRHILRSYPGLCTLGFVSVEGSSKEKLQNLEAKFTLAGEGWKKKAGADPQNPPDSRMNVVIKMRDPGYSATSAMFVQTALTILNESDKIPFKGGVLPPGAAFAKTTLVERVNARGVTFNVEAASK